MFLDFYRLQEQPFGVTPDPRFLYMSETHREALASLFYGVKSGRGFMALVAKPGMGKTSLLFRLMQNLEPTARTVFLFQTQCDSREFLKYLLADMGIQTDSTDLVKMHSQLNETLAENAKTGKQLVVIVDEAQNLDPSVLETIRLLSDFETSRQKLLQIVLSGQLQLGEKLASPSLVQLSQRISILSRLRPFSIEETSAYIQHRLSVAGYSGAPLFSAAAEELIAELSQGIPRNINNLCFNALSWGYAVKKEEISAEIIKEVAADLSIFYRSEAVVADMAPAASAETAIAAKAVAEEETAPVVTPVAGITSRIDRSDGGGSPIPGQTTHTVRYAALAAGVAVAAFLAGYGWQNYHRAARPHSSEVQAESMNPATPTVNAVPSDNPTANTAAQPKTNSAFSQPAGITAAPEKASMTPASGDSVEKRGSQTGGASSSALAEAPGNVKAVIVRPNDTLWELSRKYSPPSASADHFRTITSLNNLSDPNHIEAGQRLLLPVEPKSGTDASAGVAPPATNKTNSSAGSSPWR